MSIPGGYEAFGGYEAYIAERDQNRQVWLDSVDREAENAKAQLATQRASVDNQYRIGMAQVKNAAEQNEIDRWYKGEVVQLDQQRVKIEQATLALRNRIETGRLDLDTELGRAKVELEQGRLGLDTELGQGRLGLDSELGRGRLGLDTELGRGRLEVERGGLGLQAVSEAAKMGGPENYFQYLDYLGGARQLPGMANWLGALQGNAPQLAFTAPGAQRPAAQSFGGMIGLLGGSTAPGTSGGGGAASGGTTGTTGGSTASGTDPQAAAAAAVVKASPPSTMAGYSPDDIRALDVIQGIYGAGAHTMAPGVYESMSPAQKALFASGGRKTGHDPREFLAAHEQSRIGQAASQSRLA